MPNDAAFEVGFIHRLRFTRGVFDLDNATLRDLLSGPADRAIVVVDKGIVDARTDLPEEIAAYFAASANGVNLIGAPCVLPGGEPIKNDRAAVDQILREIHDARLCRQSYVIAVGGGALLDVVGYAAAIAHRGVRLVRLPSTTLSQDDSGVGVKNGINAFGKKNYLGVFAPPWAVINDADFLTTLADRDWRNGFSEAVKVALVRDRAFFEHIAKNAGRIRERDMEVALPIIQRSAELHLEHIVSGGDAFETTHARPLDFGHWAAHKLEQLSDYQVRHGEAVAIGIALDTIYSVLHGKLPRRAADQIIDCLLKLGFTLYHDALDADDALLIGLDEFREHLGGRLTITLLHDAGKPFDAHEIDRKKMLAARDELAELRRP